MNGETEQLDVRVIDRNGKEMPGTVRMQYWTKAARTKRAAKSLALCWTAAVFAVFLPIVHFFLVPGLLIAGIVCAYSLSRQESIVLGGQSVCPSCDAPFEIVRGPDRWPMTDMCAKCQMPVSVERRLARPAL